MKIIFLGTPKFAETVLESLINSKHQVVAVVCQPDKPVGRKQILEMPPSKILALKNNIPVYQFNKIRLEGVEPLKKLEADIMVTAAFGQILSQEVLDITPFGVFNVHASVLPKYRGSSPVQWSLINGEKTIGVTILKTLAGIDNGPVLMTKQIAIESTDTVETLLIKLSKIGADMIVKALDIIETKKAVLVPQDESQMTYYPMLKKENAKINFNLNALSVVNFVRGMEEWPVAYTFLQGKMLKVYKSSVVENNFENYLPSQVVLASTKQGLVVKAKDYAVRLNVVQIENGKKMTDIEFLNGRKIEVKTELN